MPGRALMELVYLTLKPGEYDIAFRHGDLMVEVQNLDGLTPVFGLSPSRFDLRREGFGVIEFHGPFVFKWSQFDTLEPWGPLEGSVSISVGSFTEYCRMGADVIKSSKRHPEALRGSGIKAPTEKKARASKASSGTGRAKQALRAQAQAEARRQRHDNRNVGSAPLASGSGSESSSEVSMGLASRSSSAEEVPNVVAAEKGDPGHRPGELQAA